MTSCVPRSSDADTPVAAYEALRACILGGQDVDRALGLVALRRRGMTAWTARRPTLSDSGPGQTVVHSQPNIDENRVSIVHALATMAMAIEQETHV